MTKLIKFATAVLVSSMIAPSLHATEAEADTAKPAVKQELASTCPLTDDLVAEVVRLRTYGDRFTPVIELIIAEAAKPGWTWGPDCDAAAARIQVAQD